MKTKTFQAYLPWELFARYFLGLAMIAYGMVKITGIQFNLPAEVYDYPAGELDGGS